MLRVLDTVFFSCAKKNLLELTMINIKDVRSSGFI
jgi:hypothetical protein